MPNGGMSNSDDQWRQREFKVGGDEAPKEVACGEGCSPPHREHPLPTEEESRKGQKMIKKWRIFVNSEVLNLKFFFIVNSLSGVWVNSVANFGFSSKTMNKRHH